MENIMLEVIIGVSAIVVYPWFQANMDNWGKGKVQRNRIQRHIDKAKHRKHI
jgi:hypothetical protein